MPGNGSAAGPAADNTKSAAMALQKRIEDFMEM
jgi:hypothetical protein